jgi:HAE1 family hydrophobic/amphiphilic exporter-1
MNVAKPFVRRPVMTTLVMLGVLLFGIIGYRLVRAHGRSDADPAIIVVTAGLPGATPEAMESSVATPLERQFSTITGLDTMTSTNTIGNTRIILQFQRSRNSDAAAQDVQSAIGRTLSQLPANMPSPPSYRKVSPEDLPILYLLSPADRYVETFIAHWSSAS